MAGEIQIGGTTFATESDGTVTIANVDSATNRQNLGLEIGVDVQSYDADTTKNDVANTFTANQIISVTDNTNAALRVTQLGTGNALVVEDSTNPDSTPFVVDASGNVGIGTSSPQDGLDVAKNARIGQGQISADSTVGVLGIYGGLTTSSTNSQLRFFGRSVSNTGLTYEIARISGSSFGPYSISGGIQFSTASNDGANNLTLTERMRIDSSGNLLFNSGYGSVATAYGCRAWVNFDGTGTVAIRDSGNVSSITDRGTGLYTVNLTTAMTDANFSIVSHVHEDTSTATGYNRSVNGYPISNTAFYLNSYIPSTASLSDNGYISAAIFR